MIVQHAQDPLANKYGRDLGSHLWAPFPGSETSSWGDGRSSRTLRLKGGAGDLCECFPAAAREMTFVRCCQTRAYLTL